MAHRDFTCNDRQTNAADARMSAVEILVHHMLRDTDSLENLRALLALQGRVSHFGHHLEQPFTHGPHVVVYRILSC